MSDIFSIHVHFKTPGYSHVHKWKQIVRGAKGHVGRYNHCSLTLVKSSLFLCATLMPLIDF